MTRDSPEASHCDALLEATRNDAGRPTGIGSPNGVSLSLHSQDAIGGLNAIRFLAAMCVVVGHIGLMRSTDLIDTNPLIRAVQIISRIAFNGPFAVMTFFVISGFVIHWPTTRDERLDVRAFYVRRVVRITLPAAIAFASGLLTGSPMSPPNRGIYCSLVCELAYYVAYPAMHLLAQGDTRRWRTIVLASWGLTLTVVSTHLHSIQSNRDFHAFGWHTALIGLPVWLTGVYMAQTWRARSVTPLRSFIYWLRTSIFVLQALLVAARFHAPGILGSNVVLLLSTTPLIYYWLKAEMDFYRSTHRLWKWLEAQGNWSYSLYLCHMLSWPLLLATGINLEWVPQDVEPILKISLGFILSLVFHTAVEQPSHTLARSLARRVSAASNQPSRGRPISTHPRP